jgi:hypothetical protein
LPTVGAGDAEDAAHDAAVAVVLAQDGEVVVSHAPKTGHPALRQRDRRYLVHGTATGRTIGSLSFSASRSPQQPVVWVGAGSVWPAVEVQRCDTGV